MFRNNKSIWIIGVFVTLLIAIGFYWIEVRPVLVKKQCSWYTYVQPAKEATKGITQEEADRMNKDNKDSNPVACGRTDNTYLDSLFLECKPTNIKLEEPRQAEAEQSITIPTTKLEYEECLRHKGL